MFETKMSHLILMLLLVAFKTNEVLSKVTKVDCADPELAKACVCVLDDQRDMIQIGCGNYLSDENNKLPDLPAQIVSAKKAYTRWPDVPKSYVNTGLLDLSINKIQKIGDLTNLKNLQYFNISFNLLTEINPQICTLKDLYVLDLSYNALEILYMEDFVCETDTSVFNTTSNYLFSNLEYVFLIGNKIKEINNLDLLLVGMPIISEFEISFNQIKHINISEVSVNSKNVIEKMNQVIKTYNNREYFANTISQRTEFGYFFTDNGIESVYFNFEGIYNAITDVIPISDNLLLRFSSILLDTNQIICDCGIYKDFNFLANGPFYESIYYSNLSSTFLAATQCSTVSDKVSILSVLLDNKLDIVSSFCDSQNIVTSSGASSKATTTVKDSSNSNDHTSSTENSQPQPVNSQNPNLEKNFNLKLFLFTLMNLLFVYFI